ncbi:hypothetical protein [Streptomyces bobili]|uniref:Uncharacterized protein n=1 Tax=Streptomyces bobili TaxID=67280 RepID=A0ABZ1R5V9_9ACTN|nr:hypothetical protein [Streptomyces bobili]
MSRIVKIRAVGISAIAVAALGVTYAGATASASQSAAGAVSAAPGDVYKATAVRDIGSTYTQVVALSLPAGTYTLTGSAHLIYADQARCRVTAGPNMTTPRGSGYNEASLSATGTVTLASAGKVQLLCSSEKILPVPQNAGANGTLVATRVGLLDDQGTVAP